MYVVYIAGSLKYVSGGVRVITEHANRLTARGHTVEIWLKNSDLTQYYACNATVRPLDPTALLAPDVIVMTDPMDIPQVAKHRGSKRSYLLMQHDNEWLAEISGQPATTHLIAQHADLFLNGHWGILAVSSWVKQMVAEKHGIISALVPNGIDTSLFHPSDPLINTENPKLLLAYAPQNWKGFPDAVSAALNVKKTHPNVEIMIYGGILLEYPESDPAYQSFSFPVTVFNIPDQSVISRIYSSATVFVSTSWKEGFGLPGLEALACGTPLVTTNSEGIGDYAIQGETAIVVPPRDLQAIADGIRKVLDDPGLRRKLSRNGLEQAEKFTWEKSMDELERILQGR